MAHFQGFEPFLFSINLCLNRAMLNQENKSILVPSVIGLAIIALFAFGGYKYWLLSEELKATQAEFTKAIEELQDMVSQKTEQNNELADELDEERDRNDKFAKQIKGITSTVGTIQKLNSLDPELLKKYSKISFLNENYIPSGLKLLDAKYTSTPDKEVYLHADIIDFVEDMIGDAKRAGVTLQVLSGYRSFETQTDLKSNYKVTYGTGANAFSADQGYSEHQLGTAIDFTTPSMGTNLDITFEATPAFAWLQKNADKYGFTLSYPKNNAYYQYEPWHWRFVGTELAEKLYNDNKHFYDLDQRDIDTYLLHIFD